METNDEKKARVTFDEQPKDDHTFKCDCHYPCDNYPHCGGHKITFDEQPEKKGSKTAKRIQEETPKEIRDDVRRYANEQAAGQEQEDNEYLERVLFLSLAQRDCTTDEGLDKAVEETFWNLKDKFTITRKP